MGNRVYGKFDNRIQAAVGEAFSIDLETNPTTGYEWSLRIEGEILLKRRKLLGLPKGGVIVSDTPTVSMGGGGKERFTFQSLKKGDASIIFEYRRPWEGEPLEQVNFYVRIIPVN